MKPPRPVGILPPVLALPLLALLDELQGGLPVLGSGDLGREVGTGVGLFAVLLAVPTALSLLVEPVVLAWSDRADRQRILVGALLAMGVMGAAGAVSTSPVALTVCIGLWGTACGVACGVAQGALVSDAESEAVGMAGWVRGAVIGDLAAPVAVQACGGDWRWAWLASAALPVALAVWVSRLSLPPLVADGEADPPFRVALARGLRDPVLLGWLVAVSSCTLLDEPLLVLVVLRTGGSGALATAQVLALLAGAAGGAFLTEPLFRRVPARTLLVASSVAAAVALAAWIAVGSGLLAVPLLAMLGASSAPLYTLAQAAAYARLPGRPGLVNALLGPLHWVDVVAPLALGALLSQWGMNAALAALAVQPLVCVLVARAAGAAEPEAT